MESRVFMPSGDEGVISTNDDASECKRHAVRVGYWKDDYIGAFVKNTDRRAPEINRGYYARVKGIQKGIGAFLEVRRGCAMQRIQQMDSLCHRFSRQPHTISNAFLCFSMVAENW